MAGKPTIRPTVLTFIRFSLGTNPWQDAVEAGEAIFVGSIVDEGAGDFLTGYSFLGDVRRFSTTNPVKLGTVTFRVDALTSGTTIRVEPDTAGGLGTILVQIVDGFVAKIPYISADAFFRNSLPRMSIDVKPGSDPNSINVKSQGMIPVAILTTPNFDASSVEVLTIRFGRNGTEASPAHSALEDVDGDGDPDLVVHFQTQETGILAGDSEAKLSALTSDGTTVVASDAVRAFLPGDVDQDLDVDIVDASLLAYSYESSPGTPLWTPYADFNEDKIIDILDASELAINFGQHA